MKLGTALRFGFAAMLSLHGGTGAAQGPGTGIGNCIDVDQIRATRILNDREILLSMAEGPDLVMNLKRHCPQLAFHDYFSYEATMGQLCAELDKIVTRAGEGCTIGGFRPAGPADSIGPPEEKKKTP